MPVYTYIANVDPGEKTSRLVLRNGALVLRMGYYANITEEELATLQPRYVMQAGAVGIAAPEHGKATVGLSDLADVYAYDPEQGQAIVWHEAEGAWVAGVGGGATGASMQEDLQAVESDVATVQTTATAALPKAGGTMTGKIVLDGDPTLPLHPATRQYTLAQITALVNGAPGILDTLGEIATQLAADESAAGALATALAGKAPQTALDLVESSTEAGGNLGATKTLDLAGRSNHGLEGTLTANLALTVTNTAAAHRTPLLLTQGAPGGWTLTINGSAITIPTTTGASFLVWLLGSADGSNTYVAVDGAPGPQGIQGIQGVQGIQGIQGVPGPTTPDDDSVTAAKINSALKGGPAAAVEALRALGFTSVTAAPGNHTHANTNVQAFTTPTQTWTKPTGAQLVTIVLVGGGGGSGSGCRGAAGTTRFGGGGGGGGGLTILTVRASLLNTTESVTAGLAGVGGAAVTTDTTSGNPGTAGGASSFKSSSFARAGGGALGAGGTTSSAAGGAGATSTQASFAGSAGGASATAGVASAAEHADQALPDAAALPRLSAASREE